MSGNSDEPDDIIAAASICPGCGTLAVAYRTTEMKRGDHDRWEFMCSRCGTDFAMHESELVFQSHSLEWLSAKVYVA
jgi:hypothetical protein